MKIAGGKELIYREGDTATIFAEVPSEPAADNIRDCSRMKFGILVNVRMLHGCQFSNMHYL